MEGRRVEMEEKFFAQFVWEKAQMVWPNFFGRLKMATKMMVGYDYVVLPVRPAEAKTLRESFEGKDVRITHTIEEL